MTKVDIMELIIEESKESGIDPEFLLTMANIESAFNPNARNKYSGAAGLYQFVPSTARAYGLKNPYDPKQAIRSVIKFTEANAAILARSGIPVNGANLYLAHQQGAGGAVALYRSAARGTPLDRTIRRNIDANGGRGLSAKQFIDLWKRNYLSKLLKTRALVKDAGIQLEETNDG